MIRARLRLFSADAFLLTLGLAATALGFALLVAQPAQAQALQPGEVLFGAAKISIEPAPNAAAGEYWEQDESKCELGPGLDPLLALDTRTPWPENPNCIYAGGFGLGPMNSLVQWDQEYGLWVRSVALSDGSDTIVLTLIDGIYWMGRYRNLCDRCGSFSIAEDLGAELQLPPSSFMISATHAHSAPDFIGGWGAVPQWYMDQVTRAIKDSIRQAVGNLEPATLEAGDELLRDYNKDRRDIYWSPEENTLSWFRATDRAGDVLATVAVYARHPTSRGSGTPIAHADWHGPFSKAAEDRFPGSVGIAFPSGLGNMSGRGGWQAGDDIADAIPDVGEGTPVQGEPGAPLAGPLDVRSTQRLWVQPVTNSVLLALGANGLFDRPFISQPSNATIEAGKSGSNRCVSSSPLTVETGISAMRVGSLTLTGGPGELFANITNTIREDEFEVGRTAIPIALVNDALGYIMQRFEYNEIAGQLVGFVDDGLFGYEDAYAIDGCFGTKVLDETLSALGGL